MDEPRSRTNDPVELLRRRRKIRALGVIIFVTVVVALLLYSANGGGSSRNRGEGRPAATFPCPQVETPSVSPPTYAQAPDLNLPSDVDYSAVIHTSCGDIELDLLEDAAPKTVANFIFLAEDGFFDGLPWPRVERGFVIQTGDPDGLVASGNDGPGYTIPDELPRSGREYVYGTVAMANDGLGTSGSQFFIVVHDPEEKTEPAGLEPEYSIFGRVSESSFETLDKIARMPVKGGDDLPTAVQPRRPVVIESIEIRSS